MTTLGWFKLKSLRVEELITTGSNWLGLVRWSVVIDDCWLTYWNGSPTTGSVAVLAHCYTTRPTTQFSCPSSLGIYFILPLQATQPINEATAQPHHLTNTQPLSGGEETIGYLWWDYWDYYLFYVTGLDSPTDTISSMSLGWIVLLTLSLLCHWVG